MDAQLERAALRTARYLVTWFFICLVVKICVEATLPLLPQVGYHTYAEIQAGVGVLTMCLVMLVLIYKVPGVVRDLFPGTEQRADLGRKT